MIIDNTSQCENCIYSILDESNPAKIMTFCQIDEHWRIYGSHLQCDKKIEEKEE